MARWKKQIAELVRRHHLLRCVECGKCTAACPLYELYDDLAWEASPRGIVEHGLNQKQLIAGDALWFCLACDVCTSQCPAGVEIRAFISSARTLAVEQGNDQHALQCSGCHKVFLSALTLELLETKSPPLAETAEMLALCPGCRPRAYAAKIRKRLAPLADDPFARVRERASRRSG